MIGDRVVALGTSVDWPGSIAGSNGIIKLPYPHGWTIAGESGVESSDKWVRAQLEMRRNPPSIRTILEPFFC